ncbi:putative quinol monooxygenase [Aquipuribacter sp. MA13-6]|uniref:putative quinol monooxygenase n=1 Tax=unclassified Aquipuribacter TaxID=2635084 RepID=UPI003EEA0B39
MIGIVVRFDVHDQDAAGEFDRLTAVAVAAIREREPGTLVYATHRVQDDELARVFYEVYADQAALQAHEDGAHVQAFHAAKDPLLARPPRVELVRPGPAKDQVVPGRAQGQADTDGLASLP